MVVSLPVLSGQECLSRCLLISGGSPGRGHQQCWLLCRCCCSSYVWHLLIEWPFSYPIILLAKVHCRQSSHNCFLWIIPNIVFSRAFIPDYCVIFRDRMLSYWLNLVNSLPLMTEIVQLGPSRSSVCSKDWSFCSVYISRLNFLKDVSYVMITSGIKEHSLQSMVLAWLTPMVWLPQMADGQVSAAEGSPRVLDTFPTPSTSG